MSIVNSRLAKSPQFKTRLKDTVFGIYREYEAPFWEEPVAHPRIELGYTSIEDQIRFISENKETMFRLSVAGDEVDWTSHLEELASLPNIRGLGGSSIFQKEFRAFENLEWVFLGDNCPDFDASELPSLRQLEGSFDEGTRGLEDSENITKLSLSFSPGVRFDLGILSHIVGLEALRVTYGQVETLCGLERMSNLRLLNLQDAKFLSDIQAIEHLESLSVFFVSGAKSVRNWRVLAELSSLQSLRFYNCGEIVLPSSAKERAVFSKHNFPKCRIFFEEQI